MPCRLMPVRTRYLPVAWLAILAGMGVATPNAVAQTPEFRSMWVTRFEWPNRDEATCKARIDSAMQNLASSHFNAVFFQIRGQCDTLYPSPYEVWSHLIGGADPGWDPLAYAIDAAHSRGLEFHAYINTYNCWLGSPLPTNPNHLFYKHCNAADPDHHDWLVCDSSGTPVQWPNGTGSYIWIAPGIPDFQAYWRRQVMYVVRNYDVDGVHFDYIRTAGSGYSYDPISEARRASTQGNPNNLDFHAWTADQVTRLVRDTYAEIMSVKPYVKVSAAVFSNAITSPVNVHQDPRTWAQTGGIDIIVPMAYFAGGAGSTWDSQLQTWLAGCAGRHVAAGHNTNQGVASLLEQIELTRLRGAQGNSAYSWSSFTFWNDYLTNVYPTAVPTPAMPWKDTPTTAIIHGFVTQPGGDPVVDAHIARSGDASISLSTGDGFYSMLLVPPGTYTLTASHAAYAGEPSAVVNVGPGDVVRQDLALGVLLAPVIAEVAPDPDTAVVAEDYTRQLALSQGSADAWTLIAGPPRATIGNTGIVHWYPTAVDAGHSYAFTAEVNNAAGSDLESWQVLVEAPSCSTFRIADFDEVTTGTEHLFRRPRLSGTTVNHLTLTPNVAIVTDAVPAFSGAKCYKVEWQFVDATPQRWMRLATWDAPGLPNPIIKLGRPIRIRLRLDSGRLRVGVGIREIDAPGELGQNGGTSGPIEWIGVTGTVSGAPQGVPVEPMPGVWQTLVFQPRTDPICGFTGNGTLGSENGMGTFEELAFTVVDSAGPFTVYIDDVELLCDTTPFGDFDLDRDTDLADFSRFRACFNGANRPYAKTGCDIADFDADADVDLTDFGTFRACFNGPNRPPACP